jgi:hypothetical protein
MIGVAGGVAELVGPVVLVDGGIHPLRRRQRLPGFFCF